MRFLRKRLALTLLVFAWAGCKGGLTTSYADLEAGLYALETVNGQTPPANWVVLDAANKVEFFSGSVTVNADETFLDATEFRVTQNGVVTLESDLGSGAWQQNGRTITFTPTGAEAYTMLWDGVSRLTQILEGATLVYVK